MGSESPRQRAQDPSYRTILAFDVEGYGADTRTDPLRVRIRRRVASWFAEVLSEANTADHQYVTSDTGDGCLYSIDPHVPRTRLLASIVVRLPRSGGQVRAMRQRSRLGRWCAPDASVRA